MKTLGIGVDIVNNLRIQGILQRNKDRFLKKVLHPSEINSFNSKAAEQMQVQYFASRWAAKEALVKATQLKDLVFPNIEIISGPLGKPTIILHDSNLEKMRKLYPGEYEILLSLSHDDDNSIAFVLLQG